MGENSKIEWCDHTFNPWVGCQEISPACDRCYARSWARRAGNPQLWEGARRRTTISYWQQPFKWNDQATARGVRPRVFCASLADVFDNVIEPEWRSDLFALIRNTPHLDWLLLTKRIGNAAKMLPDDWGTGYRNVWLGSTIANQEEADRDIPKLVRTPARTRFLSCEPLLGSVDLESYLYGDDELPAFIDWVIVGGESGSGARLMAPQWAREVRDGCQRAGVAFFMKQMTRKAEIPADLLIRELPNAA